MSALLSLTQSWFFPQAGENPAHTKLTEAYRASVRERDACVFRQAPSVLYLLVPRVEWESKECATCYPQQSLADDQQPASLQMFASIPANLVARTCFAAEVGSALVTRTDHSRIVNHTTIGKENRVSDIDKAGVAKISNTTHLIVAVLLHDYDVVFANFYGDEWQVSSTKSSSFTIAKSAVFETKMFLARPLDRKRDICVAFAPALFAARKLDYPPNVSDCVALPSPQFLADALRANAITDAHKRLDVERYLAPNAAK